MSRCAVKRYKVECPPNGDSDQPAHLHRLIRVFSGHSEGIQGSDVSSDVNLDSDQTVSMHRLV